jgi:peptidyl-prolyl cis-trans isomerase C
MNHSRTVFLAIALLALAACQPPKSASGSTDTSPPVATVDGTPISRDFYDFYIKGITGGKAPADLTAQQRSAALDNLIRARLVGEDASKEGLDKSGDTPFLLQIARLNVLQQAVEEHYLKDRKPTEQEKFDALAKENSMDSAKNNGGDLGWFTTNRMVPEFAGAVVALKPGEYTHKAIQTQYGWHVIQLLETREVTAPPYDQVRQRLEQVVQAKKFRMYTDELMHGAKIEKFLDQPASGSAAPAAAPPAAPAASAPGSAAPPPSAAPPSSAPPKN